MSYLRINIYHAIVLTLLLSSPIPGKATENMQCESVIIFNTSCTRCHEGECSGRMTFHLPESAAYQHIRRHAGELSKETNHQLSELLRYMKEECSFYPLPLDVPKDQIWSSARLGKLQSPSNQAYFVPLGLLEPGLYELLLDGLNGDENYCIEIINNEFDYYDQEKINREINKLSLQFQADIHSEYYLRVTSRKPIKLNQISLTLQ